MKISDINPDMLKSVLSNAASVGAVSSNAIQVDVDNAQATLNELLKVAEQCRQQKKKAQTLAASIQGCWQGQSGDELQAYIASWVKEQERVANGIETMVETMRKKLQALVDADRGLAQLIRGS